MTSLLQTTAYACLIALTSATATPHLRAGRVAELAARRDATPAFFDETVRPDERSEAHWTVVRTRSRSVTSAKAYPLADIIDDDYAAGDELRIGLSPSNVTVPSPPATAPVRAQRQLQTGAGPTPKPIPSPTKRPNPSPAVTSPVPHPTPPTPSSVVYLPAPGGGGDGGANSAEKKQVLLYIIFGSIVAFVSLASLCIKVRSKK